MVIKATRINDWTVALDNKQQSNIYANSRIDIESSALDEVEKFSSIEGIKKLDFTPDFHKGSGTPIGTVALIDRVYPKVPGNDIGCGMRLDFLSIKELPDIETLKNKLRHAFFEGGREIFVKDRAAVLAGKDLESNLYGKTTDGLKFSSQKFLGNGEISDVLNPYLSLKSERDNFLGTIGGGNHFVEIQEIETIRDKLLAQVFGVKVGTYAVMVHSGSLDNGHQVGNHFKDLAKSKFKGKHPESYSPSSCKTWWYLLWVVSSPLGSFCL